MVYIETYEKDVRYYQREDGVSPFLRWRETILDAATRARIDIRIRRVSAGNLGDCKAVGGGVFELRIHAGPGLRVYFGEDGRRIVVLLVGGEKRAQKSNIGKAQEYWADYQRRR